MSPAINPQKALSALQSLDPNMPRDDWYRVCAAARAAGLEFDSFDQWSANGASYNPSDCRSTWQSLPPQDGGIGVATLFGMAAAGGWRWKPQRSAKVVPAVDFSALLNKASAATDAPTEAPQSPAAPPPPAPAPPPQQRRPHPLKDPANVWARALPATLAHPYCKAKGVTDPAALEGLRVLPDTDPLYLTKEKIRMAGALLVPIRLPGGALQSVQCIPLAGKKANLPSPMENGFHVVGAIEPGQPVYIVEGIGAAWSVHAAGGAAVLTFGVGRTGTVAAAVQAQYPGSPLVLLPDIGQEDAVAKVAQRLDCAVVNLPGEWERNSDIWDYWHAHGTEALAELLASARKPAPAPAPPARTPAPPFILATTPATGPELADGEHADGPDGEIPGSEERPKYLTFDDFYEAPSGRTFKPGVWYCFLEKAGKAANAGYVLREKWVCSPLHIEAGTADAQDASYGRLLRFKSTRGNWQRWSMPMRALAGDGTPLAEALLDMGVLIGEKQMLVRYLQAYVPPKDAWLKCVAQTGWMDGQCKTFVLPDAAIGPDAAGVAYQCETTKTAKALYRTGGTLDGWRAGVAAVAVGNPMLVLGICTAFAGPLLGPLRAESGGLHFVGDSSTGKTSILEAGRSAWGGEDFKRTWRATANGLEGTAAMFTDALLTLDEIKQCPPKDVDEAIYMIANGQGKSRADKNGGGRTVARWRVSVLSNGEMSVATKLAEGGLRIHAGQEVRLVDIPCGGRTYEVWDNLHHYDSARAFSDGVKAQAAAHYGHAARAFLEGLTKDNTADLVQALESIRTMPELATSGESQEQRVAGRFAVLALAGELATTYGVTGWPPGEAIRAAGVGLEVWRNSRADKAGTNAERAQIVQAVTDFIGRHGDARFSDADALPDEAQRQPLIHNRAGYWRNTDTGRVYLFNSPGLREALKGHDFKRALKKLQEAGLMPPSTGRNSGKQFTIQGKKDRWYQVAPNAAHDAQEGSE